MESAVGRIFRLWGAEFLVVVAFALFWLATGQFAFFCMQHFRSVYVQVQSQSFLLTLFHELALPIFVVLITLSSCRRAGSCYTFESSPLQRFTVQKNKVSIVWWILSRNVLCRFPVATTRIRTFQKCSMSSVSPLPQLPRCAPSRFPRLCTYPARLQYALAVAEAPDDPQLFPPSRQPL